jgi:hypothetical protein
MCGGVAYGGAAATVAVAKTGQPRVRVAVEPAKEDGPRDTKTPAGPAHVSGHLFVVVDRAVKALACELPAQRGWSLARWSLSDLQTPRDAGSRSACEDA